MLYLTGSRADTVGSPPAACGAGSLMDDADRSAEEAPPCVAVAGSAEGPLAAVAADSSHCGRSFGVIGVFYTDRQARRPR